MTVEELDLTPRETRILRSAIGEPAGRFSRFFSRPLRGWDGALTAVVAAVVVGGLYAVRGSGLLEALFVLLLWISLLLSTAIERDRIIRKLYGALEPSARAAARSGTRELPMSGWATAAFYLGLSSL